MHKKNAFVFVKYEEIWWNYIQTFIGTYHYTLKSRGSRFTKTDINRLHQNIFVSRTPCTIFETGHVLNAITKAQFIGRLCSPSIEDGVPQRTFETFQARYREGRETLDAEPLVLPREIIFSQVDLLVDHLEVHFRIGTVRQSLHVLRKWQVLLGKN